MVQRPTRFRSRSNPQPDFTRPTKRRAAITLAILRPTRNWRASINPLRSKLLRNRQTPEWVATSWLHVYVIHAHELGVQRPNALKGLHAQIGGREIFKRFYRIGTVPSKNSSSCTHYLRSMKIFLFFRKFIFFSFLFGLNVTILTRVACFRTREDGVEYSNSKPNSKLKNDSVSRMYSFLYSRGEFLRNFQISEWRRFNVFVLSFYPNMWIVSVWYFWMYIIDSENNLMRDFWNC